MPNVKFDDLQPGDLLFQYAGDPYSNEFEHVVMYVGPQQGNKHLVVSHAMYESNATKTMKKNVVGLSRLPEYNYLVIRCNDRDLAERACQQALRWSKFEVPYDEKRKDGLFRRKEDAYIIESPNQMDSGIVTNHWAGSGFVNNAGEVAWKRGEHLGHHDFLAGTIYQEELVAVDRGYMKHSPVYSAANQEGILRMIKYAARQNTFPTFPNPKDNVPSDRQYERGFNCSFFSTLCYQVAACERVDLVKPLGEGEWVSNKHETTKTGHATHGALHYWNTTSHGPLANFDFSKVMPRSLMLDAKNIDCNGLVQSMTNTKNGEWTKMGTLAAKDVPKFAQDIDKDAYCIDKDAYKVAKANISEEAGHKREEFLESFTQQEPQVEEAIDLASEEDFEKELKSWKKNK